MRSFMGLVPDDGVGMVVRTNLSLSPQEDLAAALCLRFFALYLGLGGQQARALALEGVFGDVLKGRFLRRE